MNESKRLMGCTLYSTLLDKFSHGIISSRAHLTFFYLRLWNFLYD